MTTFLVFLGLMIFLIGAWIGYTLAYQDFMNNQGGD